jgi:hypothetical protein
MALVAVSSAVREAVESVTTATRTGDLLGTLRG